MGDFKKMFKVNSHKTAGKHAQLYIAFGIANSVQSFLRRDLLLYNKTFKIVYSFDPEILLL